jgi:molybdate transport repressor ModE-like protein
LQANRRSDLCVSEAIDRFGSVTDAAKTVGMTYRQASLLVHEMNIGLVDPPVQIRRSGRSSGRVLTPSGRAIVSNFRKMERLACRSLKKYCDAIEVLVGADPKSQPPVLRGALIIDPRVKDRKGAQGISRDQKITGVEVVTRKENKSGARMVR